LWPAACCSFFGSLGEPLVIIRVLEHRALGLGIVYLLRESASFLRAVEPVLGIIDRMKGHAGRPEPFHLRITHSRATGCTLIGILATGRHAHTAIVEASAASAGLFSLSRAQRARAPCDQLSGSFPVFHRVSTLSRSGNNVAARPLTASFLLGMECEHLRGRGLCRRDDWSTCELYCCSLLSRDERAGP
jgi:hypothetical protein